MELWIVRHGESTANIYKKLAGQLPGELTELGFKQAFITGERLSKEPFRAAYVSDLNRAVQTFNEIKKSLLDAESIEVNFEPLVREKHGGWLQDQAYELLDKIVRENNYPAREYRPEGGGESWVDLNKRGDEFLRKMISVYLKSPEENKLSKGVTKVLMISHGQFISEFYNVIEFWMSGKGPSDKRVSGNCSVHTIKLFCKKTNERCRKDCEDYSCIGVEVLLYNDTSHIV